MSGAQQNDEQFSFAAARIFSDVTSVELGESASIARVETPDGVFALRRWPSSTTPERVKFVRSVLADLHDLTFVPKPAIEKGESIVRIDQSLFDATTWLDGKPVRRPERPKGLASSVSLPRAVSPELIEALTSAVATMHRGSLDLAAQERSIPKLPMSALIASVHASWMLQRGRLRPTARTTPDIQRWLRTGERALPLAERMIGGSPEDARANLVIAHANLWPEHVLIERNGRVDRLSGLLDYKEVIASTPVLDLAQIAGRFNGWSDETAEAVTGAYSEAGRLIPSERRVLPAVAALDLTVETGRILVATYADLGAAYAPASMRDAVGAMLRSLESITKTMERLEGINQPGPRKWVYRQRPDKGQPKSRQHGPGRPKDRPSKPPARS